ncbi:MAG TPA: CocE/NonD family hydrolase, partial [Gemmatimonadaceae bacterium]|nr:CocE/NonD family hydrolase [Gemmatimonadaceae bacterium]
MNRLTPASFRLSVRILAASALALPLLAQVSPDRAAARETARARIRATYVKTEVRIPMRDGTKLFTAIYTPRDTTRAYPFLLLRAGWPAVGPKGLDQYPAQLGPTPRFSDEGFIFVYQDVRGPAWDVVLTHGPKEVDASTDAYDTIDWLLKNVAHNNRRAGIWGVSQNGTFAVAGMIDAHPALRAASPQAPSLERYFGDDLHHNGVLILAGSFPAPETVSGANPDAYRFFLGMGPNKKGGHRYLGDSLLAPWDSMMAHPNYDTFWQKRSITRQLAHIKPAVLFVAGWYDAGDLDGPLRASKAMDMLSAETDKTLVVGPWPHGGWRGGDRDRFGPIPFGQPTAPFFRDSVEFPFFACALLDRCGSRLA